jgi:DNA-binding GntR family transcriptional regulator
MFATGATATYILVTGRLATRIIANLPAMTMAVSPDPRRYMQLAATLRAQIADGTYEKDARIPSIRELCADHQLSRQTAGKALRLLEGEGLIHRVPGLGYHVSR